MEDEGARTPPVPVFWPACQSIHLGNITRFLSPSLFSWGVRPEASLDRHDPLNHPAPHVFPGPRSLGLERGGGACSWQMEGHGSSRQRQTRHTWCAAEITTGNERSPWDGPASRRAGKCSGGWHGPMGRPIDPWSSRPFAAQLRETGCSWHWRRLVLLRRDPRLRSQPPLGRVESGWARLDVAQPNQSDWRRNDWRKQTHAS